MKMTTQNKPDWPDRANLPSASELHGLLHGGTSCRVNGHTLSPDEHGVWITSLFSNDCGLWQDLTMERVEKFLSDMAADKDYGLVP